MRQDVYPLTAIGSEGLREADEDPALPPEYQGGVRRAFHKYGDSRLNPRGLAASQNCEI